MKPVQPKPSTTSLAHRLLQDLGKKYEGGDKMPAATEEGRESEDDLQSFNKKDAMGGEGSAKSSKWDFIVK
jgi:hypothetical protein